MPYFRSAQEWVEQSVLLLEARPSTTRVTTKYSIKTVATHRAKKAGDSTAGDDNVAAAEAPAAKPPRGSLVLKTYDPVSGVTLKYRTTKAAEVSHLVGSSLARLSRAMAAMPPDVLEESMPDAPAVGPGAAAESRAGSTAAAAAQAQHPQPHPQTGGGGKKKKKGRK